MKLNVSEASIALFLFVSGVVTLACSALTAFRGEAWQALAFAIGGLYVVVWSGRRLIPDEARSR